MPEKAGSLCRPSERSFNEVQALCPPFQTACILYGLSTACLRRAQSASSENLPAPCNSSGNKRSR